jgi:hypothetical protein
MHGQSEQGARREGHRGPPHFRRLGNFPLPLLLLLLLLLLFVLLLLRRLLLSGVVALMVESQSKGKMKK